MTKNAAGFALGAVNVLLETVTLYVSLNATVIAGDVFLRTLGSILIVLAGLGLLLRGGS